MRLPSWPIVFYKVCRCDNDVKHGNKNENELWKVFFCSPCLVSLDYACDEFWCGNIIKVLKCGHAMKMIWYDCRFW